MTGVKDEPIAGPSSAVPKKPKKVKKSKKLKKPKKPRVPKPSVSVTDYGAICVHPPKSPKNPKIEATTEAPPPKKPKITRVPTPSPPPTPNESDEETTIIESKYDSNGCESLLDQEKTTQANWNDSKDLSFTAVDEIALEGLDGITLEALWTRMSVTMCHQLPFSKTVKTYVWDTLVQHDDLEFYKLPTPRPKLVVFDRFKNCDVESGYVLDTNNPPLDIYPYVPISDKANGIVGSCSTYNERENITETVRHLTLAQATEQYGNTLVIVANQNLRNNALIPDYLNTFVGLNDISYCILERIGRSRKLGELTCGSQSLSMICKDAKTLFYYRKTLHKQHLITKQPFSFKSALKQNTYANLFFLLRFHNDRKSRKQIIIGQIINMLKTRPHYRMEYMELRRALGGETWEKLGIAKLLKSVDFRQFVRTDLNLNYRDLYPNAKKSEWKRKATGKEKTVRVIELIDPYININAIYKQEDEQKDSSSDEEPVAEIMYNVPLTKQCYDIILKRGRTGVFLTELQCLMGIDFYTIRTMTKILVKNNLILFSMVDAGRQRYAKYYAKCYDDDESLEFSQEVIANKEYGDDTFDFIADVLGVQSSDLRGERSESPDDSPPNRNQLKGEYDVLREIRQSKLQVNLLERFKTKFDVDENSQKLGQKMIVQEIYSNFHGYVDHQTSVEKKLLIALDAPDVPTNDFCKVVTGIFGVKKSNIGITLYPDKVKPNESSIDSKLEHELKATLSEIRETRKIETLSGTLQKLFTKQPNAMAMKYKMYLQKYKILVGTLQLDAKSNKELPSEIFSSDDEILDDSDSLANNLDNVYYARKANVDLEAKKVLIDHFETSQTIIDKLEDVRGTPIPVKRRKILDDGPPSKRSNVTEIQEESSKDAAQNIEEAPDEDIVAETKEDVDTFKVKHEAFMGPNPVPIIHNTDADGIETKVLVSTKPEECEAIKPMTVSERVHSRAKFIKDAVSKHKVISDISKILQLLTNEENKEGYDVKVDRKSIFRICTKLVKEGAVKIVKLMMRYENVIRSKTMMIHPDVEIHTFIQSAIEQFKLGFFLYAKRKVENAAEAETSNAIPETIKDEKQVSDETEQYSVMGGKLDVETGNKVKYRYSRTVGKIYGFYPKVAKMRVLHEFLYYILYDYNGSVVSDDDTTRIYNQHCDSVDDKLMKESSTLYQREASWKMFIPPLPEHKNWPNGWVLICDALLRLPVSTFVKIFNITYVIPELPKYYLNHPIRKHYLVKNLPPDTRDAILCYRKYIFSIYEIFSYLCYLGLLRFGPQKFREKDQQFVFLNKNAILYDTTTSEAGYHQITQKEYPKHSYHFTTIKDVEKYWTDMFSFSMHTKLGQRATVLGKFIKLENVHCKPSIMESLKQETPESAVEKDVGYITGDGLGACCCDSALWLHVKRNWIWSSQRSHSNIPSGNAISGLRKKHLEDVKPIKFSEYFQKTAQKTSKIRPAGGESRSAQPVHKVSKKKMVKPATGMTYKKKAILRKVKPRKQLPKKEHVDSIDKAILDKMGKSRAVFCHEEDNLILLCKAVVEYLCPNYRKRVVVNSTIRDFIHRILPYSRKTSKAYKRRIVQLKKTENLQDEKKPFSFNLNADYFTQKHFKRAKEKLRNVQSTISELEISLTFLYLAYFTYTRWKATPKSQGVDNLAEIKDYLTSYNIHKYDKFVAVDEDENIYQDAENEDDINLDTIKSVIHSSLGCQNASQEWPYQLLKVYQSFSENLLRMALNVLRDQQLISGKRSATKHSGSKEGSILMRGTSYHLSFAYTFKQITKYPSYIFNEAHETFICVYRNLPILKTAGKSIEKFEQGHGLGLSEIAMQKKLNYMFDLPSDIITLDPNALDSNDLIEELALRYKALMSKKIQDVDNEETTSEDTEVCKRIETVFEVYLKSQFSKDEKEQEEVQNVVDCDLGKIFDGDVNTEQPSSSSASADQASTSVDKVKEYTESFSISTDRRRKSLRISDLAFLLTKGLFPELDDDDRLEKLNKHFVVRYPTCKFFVGDDTIAMHDHLYTSCHTHVMEVCDDILDYLKKDCLVDNIMPNDETIKTALIISGGNMDDELLAEKIINFVYSRNIYGATSKQLNDNFKSEPTTLGLNDVLKTLIQTGIVLRVGICKFAFVHFNYRHNWTVYLDSSKNPNLEKNTVGYRVKIAPWIRIDGSLHEKVLINWLSIILSHCLSYPFIPLSNLWKRFCYVKPVDIFCILELLQQLTCVRIFTFKEAEQEDLFTEAGEIEQVPAQITDDFSKIFVETDKMAIVKFGAFLNRNKTDYSFPSEE